MTIPDKRILLLGKNGQLGWELQRTLGSLAALTAIDYEEVDFTDPGKLQAALRELAPQIIVNAAAYTDVDKAEGEKERAYAINAAAPRVMAEEAKRSGAVLIHYSTDYVFDGKKPSPYTESETPNPLNVYGASKLDGERAIESIDGSFLIFRTAWVYSVRGNNFVNKVLEWSRKNHVVRIVDDQVSNPTWARFLAEVTTLLLARAGADVAGWVRERRGLYHLAGGGYASRLAWARAILDMDPKRSEQVIRELLPATSSEFPTPAARPLFSALECSRFTQVFDLRLVDWQESLRLAMAGR